MKSLAASSIALLLFTHGVASGASWSSIGFVAPPQNAPALIAAADRMLASPIGKEFPGQLLLQVNVADGANAATHAWVPVYESAAQREEWVAKLQATPAWAEFLNTIQQLSDPAGTTMYRTTKSWGDVNDSDSVWALHSFRVTDPAAFQAAIDAFLKTPTGQAFPGQVHLSAVVAGGITPVTTVISVGYESEAEMEAWVAKRNASPDWGAYLEASGKVSEFLGTSLARTAKRWGTATIQQMTD